MSNNSEDNDIIIEGDTTLVENNIITDTQEETADTAILEIVSPIKLLHKKIESIIEDFKVGKIEDFKNMMIGIFYLIRDNHIRINELEGELEEIKNQFYRNELTEKDFEEILLLDEED